MNKKLKIYSGLFLATLLVLIVTNVFHFNKSITTYSSNDEKLEFVDDIAEFSTYDTLVTGEVVAKFNKTFSMEVFVKPKKGTNVLCSTAADQIYKVDMQKVKLVTPAETNTFGKFPFVFGIISSVLGMIITIWILVMVFILIHSIRKGNVFVAQVSKYLEITGILLSVKYVYNWINSYIIQHYLINHVRMAGYDIVYKYESASIYIIIGLALLIISQIILMGKDLKEDVDLTV